MNEIGYQDHLRNSTGLEPRKACVFLKVVSPRKKKRKILSGANLFQEKKEDQLKSAMYVRKENFGVF
jgi:hypothetical protein